MSGHHDNYKIRSPFIAKLNVKKKNNKYIIAAIGGKENGLI